MAATTELTTLHRAVDEVREAVAGLGQRHGDIPAVRRLLGDIERIDLDASELDDLTPLLAASTPEASEILMLDDIASDSALWAGADDEGVGGYHR